MVRVFIRTVVRNYVRSSESCSYSGIMSRKSGCSYSGLMLVILDSACIRDSGNLEWRLVILDYARSTGFQEPGVSDLIHPGRALC